MNREDARLIRECAAGRAEAFGELVTRYQDRLTNALARMLGDLDDAMDVAQEAFISAYQSLGRFKGDSEFYTWLYRIAFNAAVSHRRKRKSGRNLDIEGVGLDPADESALAAPGDRLDRDEDDRRVQDAITRLSPDHRAVLVLKEIDGMRYDQIAEMLDVPVGTVRSRLHRARLELKDLLTESDAD